MIIEHSTQIQMPKRIINISDYDEDSRLCCGCVSDRYLSGKIRNEGEEDDCSFCDYFGHTFSLGTIAELVERAFNEHFERTSREPSDWDYWRIRELDYDWDRDGEQVHYVIAEIAGIDEDVAEVITMILENRHSDWDLATMGEETEFDRDSHYSPKSLGDFSEYYEEWSAFERRLQFECRLPSRSDFQILDRIFAGIGELTTREQEPVIRAIGPSLAISALFRARVFQSFQKMLESLKRPDREIGSPPDGIASAGRMNARGISVFYGSLTPEIALAEVRPPVGSHVVVAKFDITRPLRVLDIAALRQILVRRSYFDPDCRPLQERATFLDMLSSLMTRPVMPEYEHADYLITQVIADYLASEHRLDGMIYPSVQISDGVNVVLFHRACLTESLELPQGTVISADREGLGDDGPGPNFLVVEEVPATQMQECVKPEAPDFDLDDLMSSDFPLVNVDSRSPSLRICLDDVVVRRVTSVKYVSEVGTVKRSRRNVK